MSLFAVADTHLSFGLGVDKPMSVFGASWDNYEARLKEAWLGLVRPEDTVIVAGDISWGLKLSEALPDLLWLASLPGEKLILRGNHDLWWSSMAKMKDIHPTLHFIQNSSWLGDGFIVLGSRGWLCPGGRDFTEAEERSTSASCSGSSSAERTRTQGLKRLAFPRLPRCLNRTVQAAPSSSEPCISRPLTKRSSLPDSQISSPPSALPT